MSGRAVLRLSAKAALASNASEMVKYLREQTPSLQPTATTTSAAGGAGGGSGSDDVYLDIEGVPLPTVVDQIKGLYDAATAVVVDTPINIVLRRSSSSSDDVSSGNGGGRPLVAADLHQALGYHLHEHVALGGTFDRLHPGHKLLLTTSLLHTKSKLRVGVTGPALLKNKKFAEMLQPYEVRTEVVRQFLSKQRADVFFDVVELTEPTGGTTEIADVTAMVCSPETLPAIASINEARAKNGLAPVAPVSIEYVGGDATSRVSSTALRQRAVEHRPHE